MGNQFRQLADAHPLDLVDFGREAIIGFIGERGGDDLFYAGATSGVSEETRINAVAGDDTEDVQWWHARQAIRKIVSARRRNQHAGRVRYP